MSFKSTQFPNTVDSWSLKHALGKQANSFFYAKFPLSIVSHQALTENNFEFKLINTREFHIRGLSDREGYCIIYFCWDPRTKLLNNGILEKQDSIKKYRGISDNLGYR